MKRYLLVTVAIAILLVSSFGCKLVPGSKGEAEPVLTPVVTPIQRILTLETGLIDSQMTIGALSNEVSNLKVAVKELTAELDVLKGTSK